MTTYIETIRRNNMMLLEQILTYIATGVGALGTLIGILMTILKSVKAGKNSAEAEKAKNMLVILEEAQKHIIEVEGFLAAEGKLKKEIVTAKILNFARNANIDVDEDMLSEVIDKIVGVTKQVNARNKDIVANKLNDRG